MRLEGKTAIVTGGATGIGRAIALRFAQEGVDLSICTSKRVKELEEAAREIEAQGRRALALQADIRKLSEIDRLVNETIKAFGKIDILVNNAGVSLPASLADATEEDWDNLIDTHLKGTFFCIQKVVPHMLKQGKGKIINLASTFGFVGYRGWVIYCTAKGGVVNMTRVLALELAPLKINVNAIGPGTTATPLIQEALADPEKAKPYIDRIPYGRMALPEEMAAGAVYLASDEADFVNGHCLMIDGGWLAQ
ncbi:MAG: SDR family NAD(P)-dependent oxidoreductase [Nitrospinota bacterium]